ncbi:LOB domain-containing protein 12 [Glycine soja]|nr:LOB domain-containing protein 12 [Glycine soja]
MISKFAIVHKVFGCSNVTKMLKDLPVHQREDAVSSLVQELQTPCMVVLESYLT